LAYLACGLPKGSKALYRAWLITRSLEWVWRLQLHSPDHPYTHRELAANISMASGAKVLLPDYRLAPEHPEWDGGEHFMLLSAMKSNS